MSAYLDELTKAMTLLGQRPDTLFIGQSVACEGTPIRATFAGVPEDRLIEFPVAENLQMGVSTGLALEGFLPISVFPRWNFLLLAADQLINHLDRLPLYSTYLPKVIIRTAVGRSTPLDPGPQHQDDFTWPMAEMLKTIRVKKPDQFNIGAAYFQASQEQGNDVKPGRSTLIVEDGNLYT